MPAALSTDLRLRVVKAVESGVTYEEAASIFEVGRASVSRWVRQWREKKNLEPRPCGGSKSPLDEEDASTVLRWLVESDPDATLDELVSRLKAELGLQTNDSSVSAALSRMGLTRKKKSFIHNRRLDEDVKAEREAFINRQPTLTTGDLVFIDEAGVNQSMTPSYGRSPVGERVHEHRPSIRTAKTSLVGAITVDGVVDVSYVDGSYNAKKFLSWVTEGLLPKLSPGMVIIWDNIKFHANHLVVAAVHAAGCTIAKMPPYSPDLNPIEEAWSKVKHYIRAAKARTREALRAAIEAAVERVVPADTQGWVRHAGYTVLSST